MGPWGSPAAWVGPSARAVSPHPSDDSKSLQNLRPAFSLGSLVDLSMKREFPLGWKDEDMPFLHAGLGAGARWHWWLLRAGTSCLEATWVLDPTPHPPVPDGRSFHASSNLGFPWRPDDCTPRLWGKHRGGGILQASLLHVLPPASQGGRRPPLSSGGPEPGGLCCVSNTCTWQAAGLWC